MTGAKGPTGAQGPSAVVIGGAASSLRRTNTTYLSIFNPPSGAASGSESLVTQELTVAGTLSQLRIRLSAGAGGSGTSYTFRVRRNGANTTVQCTAAASQTSCSDSGNSAAFAAGDLISIAAVPSQAQPWDDLDVRWTAKLVP